MILNSIYHGDCLYALNEIKDESIDMILCDLPYNTTKAKWDVALDLTSLWNHYERIIKPNGAILLFAQTTFDKVLGCSNLPLLRYEWIWEKTQATGFLNAKKMPLKAHENILVFYKKPPKYNPQKTQGHKPMHSYTKKPEIQNKTELYGDMNKTISGGGDTDRYPRSVLKFASDKQKTKLDGTIHPTQKPLALCEYLIKTYTDEGDLILDNTAGSGTTGLAAKNLNRKFILMEKELKWIEVIRKRIPDIEYIGYEKVLKNR
jgi:site-specific DNA-methyltransferase (adenine-specific)